MVSSIVTTNNRTTGKRRPSDRVHSFVYSSESAQIRLLNISWQRCLYAWKAAALEGSRLLQAEAGNGLRLAASQCFKESDLGSDISALPKSQHASIKLYGHRQV